VYFASDQAHKSFINCALLDIFLHYIFHNLIPVFF